MSTKPKPHYTPEEYLALERATEEKREYFDGEIFAMGGASERHVLIVSNLVASFVAQFRGKPCRAYSTDLRVKVSPTGLYTYPDLAIVCGEREFDDKHRDTLLNPKVLIEVLSSSTETYDRGKKFSHYRTLDSLDEYLLVAQDERRIEHYVRQPDGGWLMHEATQPEDTLVLPSVDCELKVADVYDKIEFSEDEQRDR